MYITPYNPFNLVARWYSSMLEIVSSRIITHRVTFHVKHDSNEKATAHKKSPILLEFRGTG